ncbi:MAG: carboxypeptidase-like regulatory domain-containing protein [Bacteroidota bacterium]
MKTRHQIIDKKYLSFAIFWFIVIGYLQTVPSLTAQQIDTSEYIQFSGLVKNSKTKNPLEFANIVINKTNISTVSNSEGEFLLKVPKSDLDKSITITYLGYYNKEISIGDLTTKKNVILLDEFIEKLSEVSLIAKDPQFLIDKVIENIKKNYFEEPVIMTAFYRESIKKRKKYASLSEAVVEIYKQPYKSMSYDYIKLNQARKSSDYRRLDTLLIKLQGGPYNALNFDIIKNNKIIFNEDVFNNYRFTFDKSITINNRPTYVLSFKQYSNIPYPLFYGKLYIDANSYALSKAVISLNLESKESASRYFVKKKPYNAKVEPKVANYQVDFLEKNGKWYYGYSRIELAFKIDWDKKLFNSMYYITIEMAVTDWKPNTENISLKNKEKLKSNIILNDRASGFSDPEFWGDYNVIEPEKSIENAIKKIQRQLERN